MRRTLIVFSIMIIGLMAASPVAFGFDGPGEGYASEQQETCIMETLSGEEQDQFLDIIEIYQEKINEFREKMRELREDGNYEAFQEAKEERDKIKAEKREELSKVVPEEHSYRFESKGRQHHHNSWEKGSSNFNKQERSQQEQWQ